MSSSPTAQTKAPSSALLTVVVLCFGGMSAALMQTLVIPIQSALPQLLHTSPANASWVITATLLGGAVAMPIAGRLADMIGKQRVLLGSAVLLVAGSLICGVQLCFVVGAAAAFVGVAIAATIPVVRRREQQREVVTADAA